MLFVVLQDTIAERKCCKVCCKCFGDDGQGGSPGPPGIKVRLGKSDRI